MAATGFDTKKFLPGQGKFLSIIKIPFCAMSGVIPLFGIVREIRLFVRW